MDEIAVCNVSHVFFLVSTVAEQVRKTSQIGHGFNVRRTLFTAKAPIKIGTQPDVFGIPGQLTDMIHVMKEVVQGETCLSRGGFSPDPARDHHPCIQGAPDNGVALEECFNLVVIELPIVRHQ
jgi:hypothetical protein